MAVRDSAHHLAAHFSAPAQRERERERESTHSSFAHRSPSVHDRPRRDNVITPTTLFIRWRTLAHRRYYCPSDPCGIRDDRDADHAARCRAEQEPLLLIPLPGVTLPSALFPLEKDRTEQPYRSLAGSLARRLHRSFFGRFSPYRAGRTDERSDRKRRARWCAGRRRGEELGKAGKAGWQAGRPAQGVRSCSTWPRDWVSPTLDTFVSPFVRLVLISPSRARKTTAAFSRRLSLAAGRSRSSRPRCLPLAASPHSSPPPLAGDLPPSLSLPPSWSASSQHPSPDRGGGTTVQLLSSRSFARSFLSVIPAVGFVVASYRRLSASRYRLRSLTVQPESLARGCDSPAGFPRDYACAIGPSADPRDRFRLQRIPLHLIPIMSPRLRDCDLRETSTLFEKWFSSKRPGLSSGQLRGWKSRMPGRST